MSRPVARPYYLVGVETISILDGAGHYLELPSLTTTQRDALSPSNGMMIYNSTTNQIEAYQNGAWDVIGGGVDTPWTEDHDASGYSLRNLLALDISTTIPTGKTVNVASGQFTQILLPVEHYTNGIAIDGTLQVDGGLLLVGL